MTDKVDLYSCPRAELLQHLKQDEDFPVAFNYYILIALPTIEELTAGGIYIPEETREISAALAYTGRVVSIGKTAGIIPSYSQIKEIKIGDWVQYPPYNGRPTFYDGYKFLAITDQQVVAQHFNLKKQTDDVSSTYKIQGVDHVTR